MHLYYVIPSPCSVFPFVLKLSFYCCLFESGCEQGPHVAVVTHFIDSSFPRLKKKKLFIG